MIDDPRRGPPEWQNIALASDALYYWDNTSNSLEDRARCESYQAAAMQYAMVLDPPEIQPYLKAMSEAREKLAGALNHLAETRRQYAMKVVELVEKKRQAETTEKK